MAIFQLLFDFINVEKWFINFHFWSSFFFFVFRINQIEYVVYHGRIINRDWPWQRQIEPFYCTMKMVKNVINSQQNHWTRPMEKNPIRFEWLHLVRIQRNWPLPRAIILCMCINWVQHGQIKRWFVINSRKQHPLWLWYGYRLDQLSQVKKKINEKFWPIFMNEFFFYIYEFVSSNIVWILKMRKRSKLKRKKKIQSEEKQTIYHRNYEGFSLFTCTSIDSLSSSLVDFLPVIVRWQC